ncbi:ATPase ARSA1-like [Senna tora]|uniref:ATPase ARSA1-like n=1 Tax=Senna tora TaxID=362788 RepID=A0A834TPZ3_9FABA|nr:ATPase ARSA1-like [Senna tora]
MLGGKGGVGKTSCAASLAVKFANHGHPTMVVSTDPAHSLSDSFGQDLTGGSLVSVEGVNSPLCALEINPEKSMEEFHTAVQNVGGGAGVKNLMESMGLGMITNQLGDLNLDEMLHSPPPGTDEIIAISKVMQFLESPEYAMFTRIVFDTAPTGHTLRLLSLPDFLDGSIGKVVKLKKKLSSTFKSLFGKEEAQSDASDNIEKLKEMMAKVQDLFHNADTTEFIIVTIPTVMAISESSRLHASLKKESVPDQMRAIESICKDSELGGLKLFQDGAGRVGKMLFARQGKKFDYDLKQMRFTGDLLMELRWSGIGNCSSATSISSFGLCC